MSFGFTYYADTFIYDGTPTDTSDTASDPLQSQMWKQVVTQGFPTYRAQAQLVADPQTGRTYLFGGFTNNQYVPTRQDAVSRSFGDIWELRVDLPGGNFAGVDVEDEGRTAAAGPWQRCFTCGSAGQWKKCAGTFPIPCSIGGGDCADPRQSKCRGLRWTCLLLRCGLPARRVERPQKRTQMPEGVSYVRSAKLHCHQCQRIDTSTRGQCKI